MKPQCIIERAKSHQFKARQIDVFNLTCKRCDAHEIGRSLRQGCKPSLVGISRPLLKGNCRLICAGRQQQPLGFGRKRAARGACGKRGVAAQSDRRGCYVQVRAAGNIGNESSHAAQSLAIGVPESRTCGNADWSGSARG